MKPREIFLRSIGREPTPRPACGSATSIVTMDLMDRVGVFFPEAHCDAKQMAALAAAGHTVLGLDNVMPLFSAWQEAAALGCRMDWGARDRMPDSKHKPYEIGNDVVVPDDFTEQPAMATPLEAIRLLKRQFGDEVAVMGKVFGPWTLAYHLFGVGEFLLCTIEAPDLARRIIEQIRPATIRSAMAQIDAGADALCYADHATRDLCSPDAYRDFLKDLHADMAATLPCPLVLHICGDTADRIGYIRETGMDCFHFDSKVPTARARELAGEGLSLMGGTSNYAVVREGDREAVSRDVAEKIEYRIDIIGPECAVPLDAPYENIAAIAEEVKRQGRPSNMVGPTGA